MTNKLISLTELGSIISINLLLTVRNPHIFTLCMLLKEKLSPLSKDDVCQLIYADSKRNRMQLDHILDCAIEFGLVEYK